MSQPKLSAPFSLLALLSLSLATAVLGHTWQTGAFAQPVGVPPGVFTPQNPYGMQRMPQPIRTGPPNSAPINGNVYQSQAGANQDDGPENVMIILDSSYSMAEPINGRSGENKMTAAKRAVLNVVQSLSPSTRVGLRVYGNSGNSFTACRATDVLVPLGNNNRNLIGSKMIGIRPTGATPISYTVERSLNEDFRGLNGKKSIILISDGIETCGEDPCNVAVRMQQQGINIKINVVGFGLQDYAAEKQLRCVALGTKGKYYSANTAAELADSLNKATAVETRVQGTILTPSAPASAPAPAAQNEAASPPSPKPVYEDKMLPADLPKKSGTR